MITAAGIVEQFIDDALVRVTRFTLAPDAQTAWHPHEAACKERLASSESEVRAVPVGIAYLGETGVRHNVINAPMVFVEAEIKSQGEPLCFLNFTSCAMARPSGT